MDQRKWQRKQRIEIIVRMEKGMVVIYTYFRHDCETVERRRGEGGGENMGQVWYGQVR